MTKELSSGIRLHSAISVIYIENGPTGLRPFPRPWSKEQVFALRLCPQIEGDTMLLKQKFQPFLEYLRKKGYKEKSIKEYKNCLYGALSHSIQDIGVCQVPRL